MTDATVSVTDPKKVESSRPDIFTVRGLLSIGVMLSVIGLAYTLLFIQMPQANREVMSTILGALLMALKDAFSYAFGSSASSDRKTEALISKGAPE